MRAGERITVNEGLIAAYRPSRPEAAILARLKNEH